MFIALRFNRGGRSVGAQCTFGMFSLHAAPMERVGVRLVLSYKHIAPLEHSP
jgi:hypothetical protein